jgi:hypothetical protein
MGQSGTIDYLVFFFHKLKLHPENWANGGIQPAMPRWESPNRCRRPGCPPETHEASKFRWKGEQSHLWWDNWRGLASRYDWYTQNYVALLTILCFMVALSKILE